MAKDEILTDDYIAGLLAKDAKESSIKYSSLGLEAFGQSKYVPSPHSMQNSSLTTADLQQISPSQTPVSCATSSRIPTVIMPHYLPKKLQSPARVCEVLDLMNVERRKQIGLEEEIFGDVNLAILQQSWGEDRRSGGGLGREGAV
jgi:hypothetical protein